MIDRVFVHKRNSEGKWDPEFYSFESLPDVGELIFLGPNSPWYRVELVLNSAAPYHSEIFVNAVDFDEGKAQAQVDAKAH